MGIYTQEKKQGLIGPIDEKYISKDAVWISESVIALIIGDVCESIIDGGNLYIYEFKDNQLRKLTNWDLRRQAVKLEYIGGVLYFEGIKYIEGKSKGFIGILSI
ncbi:hypothetical protein [Bacillus cereus]|uniref:hypothetical protein n=1 Tax=Bacillus cereus TaxID=1396 RepID=UPI0003AB3394|nr:hypothetical protein [Bacillus cereus]